MAICKFFQQGRCKFGDSCRYEHIGGGNANYSRNRGQQHENRRNYDQHEEHQRSYVQPSKFDNQSRGGKNYRQPNDHHDRNTNNDYSSPFTRNKQSQQTPQQSRDRFHWNRNANPFGALSDNQRHPNDGAVSDDDVNTINTIREEIGEWLRSKTMWPYSCYKVLNKNKCVEGLPDIQPEELKVLYRLHGAVEFQKILGEVDAMYGRRKAELAAMSDETRSSLLSALHTTIEDNPSLCLNISTMYGPGLDFGTAQSASTVTPSSADPSSFATAAANPSSFSSPPTNQSPFSAQSTNQTPFSTSPATQPFSFKLPASQSPDPSTSSTQPTNQTPFSSQGATQSSSFGQSLAESSAPQPQIAGRTQMFKSVAPSAANAPAAQDTAYTPKDQLTQAELQQFMAPSFTVGKYPLRPPPRDLCF